MSFPYGTTYGKRGQQREKETSLIGGNPLGTVMVLPDGSLFVHAKAGGTIAAARLVQQDPTSTTYDADIAVAVAAAVGASSVSLTNAAATLAADRFAKGTMHVNDEAGEAFAYGIRTQGAATTTEDFTVELEEGDEIVVALTTSSQVGLRENAYDSVLISPATFTGMPVGVTPLPVVVDDFFWLQVYGRCALLSDAVIWIAGQPIVPSFTVAGSARTKPTVQTASGVSGVVGWAENVSASGEHGLAFLTIGAR